MNLTTSTGPLVGSPIRRIVWTAVLIVVALALAGPAAVQAGYFETDDLHDCVGYTMTDLATAPEGTELPFGGVRVFRKDAQKGNSHAYCFTMHWFESQGCCWAGFDIVLPPGLRRDAESLRFIAASGCLVRVDFHRRSTMESIFRRGFSNGSFTSKRRDKEIPKRFDNRGYAMDSFLSCWGGET